MDPDELSEGNLEVGFRPQKLENAGREPQPETEEDGQQAGGPEPARRASGSEGAARLARLEEGGPASTPGPAEFQTCSPGWSSAFYEADCFGADVHGYVEELGLCTAARAPDAPSPVSARPPSTAVGWGARPMFKRVFRLSLSLRVPPPPAPVTTPVWAPPPLIL